MLPQRMGVPGAGRDCASRRVLEEGIAGAVLTLSLPFIGGGGWMEVWTDGLVGLSEALGAEVRLPGRVRNPCD